MLSDKTYLYCFYRVIPYKNQGIKYYYYASNHGPINYRSRMTSTSLCASAMTLMIDLYPQLIPLKYA